MRALRAIGTLLLIWLVTGCVTVDRYGNIIETPKPKKEKPVEFNLASIAIKPNWSPADVQISMVLAGLPLKPPARFQLPYLPDVGNQGAQPSGTAWAAGYVAFSIHRRRDGQKTYSCSPSFIYNQLHRANQGIEIINTLNFLQTSGCSDLKHMPYVDFDYTTRPTGPAIVDAARNRISGFGRVDFTDVNQVRAHLLQGSAIIATLRVTDNFLKLKKLHWKKPRGVYMGRHTVAVVGYDQKLRAFLIQNSAGTEWGEKGYAYVPYDWFIRLTGQAYVLW